MCVCVCYMYLEVCMHYIEQALSFKYMCNVTVIHIHLEALVYLLHIHSFALFHSMYCCIQ